MAAATAMVHDLITSMKRAARHWESRKLRLCSPFAPHLLETDVATGDTFVPNTMQPPNRGNKLKRKDNPLAEAYADERPYKKVRLRGSNIQGHCN